MTEIYRTVFGSRLYGTTTPKSDTDWKILFAPSLRDLLYGESAQNIFRQQKAAGAVKNDADSIDTEHIPLQEFLRDIYAGQSYAVEMLFKYLQDVDSWDAGARPKRGEEVFLSGHHGLIVHLLREVVDKYLTRDVSGMIGFAVGQANRYGIKGRRLRALLELREWMEGVQGELVRVIGDRAPEMTKFGQVVERADFPVNERYWRKDFYNDPPAPCVNIAEKVYPHSISFAEAQSRLDATIKQYGQRTKVSMDDGGLDWKAISHAYRICTEVIELLQTKRLVFPLHNRDYLRQIKLGLVPYEQVSNELTALLEQIDELKERSALPAKTPELQAEYTELCKDFLENFYEIGHNDAR